jgi:hypothetical protein
METARLPEIPTDGSVHVIRLKMGLYALIDIADLELIDGWRFYVFQVSSRHWNKTFACLNFPIARERSAITGEVRPDLDFG